MTRLVVGPFNRVEGDLEVKIDHADGAVVKAEVVSPLYRGFERILLNKPPLDSIVYAPRICGICSVSQSVAAARALTSAMNLSIPANGELATNLIHATENVADHLTHFYLFFMPDFARPIYAREAWYEDIGERFTAMTGTAVDAVLPARAQFMHILGILAGKWPHTLSIQPGGSTRSVAPGEIARLAAILTAFRRFLERSLFGDSLERVGSLDSESALTAWAAEKRPHSSDFRRFLNLSAALDLKSLGPSTGNFLSYGAYSLEGRHLFGRGVIRDDAAGAFNPASVAEDLTSSWYRSGNVSEPPVTGSTEPDAEKPEAYSWCKAPRSDGTVMEVGALARQMVDGHPLIRDLVGRHGGSVHTRVVARVLEMALVVMAMETWVRSLKSGEPYITHGDVPASGQGIGLTEAARGSLGHWVSIEKGRIENYQIVAPTTWNFSPRDKDGIPGPLEQALVGAPVRKEETDPVSVQHIVRSFDPCLVCTVH
ncbi:nickel-dependent hydrogenase large subunit [Roseibium sp. MMSF_3544]|uniref:nickel-dependent hydrogenase large subunit n=1 Tax=unclassified Roseibium TaxID=2629323 RepID=UPI00273F1A64|nr:nickel-dependent hydrogenase large subunit [Roseibium sp. MMSF_3544]